MKTKGKEWVKFLNAANLFVHTNSKLCMLFTSAFVQIYTVAWVSHKCRDKLTFLSQISVQ